MLQRIVLAAFLTVTLQARENPFFPSEGEQDLPYTTNRLEAVEPLKRATISLPLHARVLQNVTVEYKNLDGSVESKTIEVNNAIDAHLPIFISQSYGGDSVQTVVKEKGSEPYTLVGTIPHAKFYEKNKTFKIETTDKLLRHFLLSEPHRIVLDFQSDATLKSYIKKQNKSPFKVIRVGNHKGYYRVVLELDGAYRYELISEKEGSILSIF